MSRSVSLEEPNAYQKYLAEIHSKFSTPDDLILGVAREATGQESNIKPKKIVAGEANEVYFVKQQNGSEVVVRISRWSDFKREQWAMEKCKEKGVPVADIMLIKEAEFQSEKLHFCVQPRLPGEPLERGNINYHDLDRKYLKRLIVKSGEILSKIHSIPTNGFGEINGEGQGEFFNFNDAITENGDKESYLRLARETNFPEESMQKLLQFVFSEGKKFQNLKPFLSHGDFNVKHIMVAGEQITGILDFGEVTGHSPVGDFAKWEYWFGEELPLDWLKEGYSNQNLFNSDFLELMLLIQLRNGTHNLHYHHGRYPAGVEAAKQKLHELLAQI